MAPVVVFDTNILFSALGWQGRPAACLERARLGIVEGVTSQALLDELAEKLRGKLAFTEEQITDTLIDLLSFRGIAIISAVDFLTRVQEG